MSNDAIVLLKDDHRNVKSLFRQFEKLKETGGPELEEVVHECCRELVVHAQLEEELFYPAARQAIDDELIILEAGEEHHVADVLIQELLGLSSNDETYVAKFVVLMEATKHHIDEEEQELFPKVRDALGRSELQEIGERMQQRREELLAREPLKVGLQK